LLCALCPECPPERQFAAHDLAFLLPDDGTVADWQELT
jgi:hypothetical protein